MTPSLNSAPGELISTGDLRAALWAWGPGPSQHAPSNKALQTHGICGARINVQCWPFLQDFYPNRYQFREKIGQRHLENLLLAAQTYMGDSWAWARGPEWPRHVHCKKAVYHQVYHQCNHQAHTRPTPSSTQPTGKPASVQADWPSRHQSLTLTLWWVFILLSPEPGPQSSTLGTLEPHPRSLPANQKETVPFEATQNLQSGKNLHAPLRPHPLPAALPGHKNQSLTHRLTPILNSAPRGMLPQRWQIRPAMPLGWNPIPRLGSQASIPRDLASKPSRLVTPWTTPQDTTCHPEGNLAIWRCTKPSDRDKPACSPYGHPHYRSPPDHKHGGWYSAIPPPSTLPPESCSMRRASGELIRPVPWSRVAVTRTSREKRPRLGMPSPLNAGQFSQGFCPNRYQFGQRAPENWP